MLCCMCCRTAHQNVGQLQDLYLPTNTLAALANLAPQVRETARLTAQCTQPILCLCVAAYYWHNWVQHLTTATTHQGIIGYLL
jgi:hypothetical protein